MHLSQPLKFIHVGLGGFGSSWCHGVIPAIAPRARMVAAVDINPAVFPNAVACGLPLEKCYTDLRTALEENEADFITIVTPPHFHEQAIDLAIAFGCDIVCEKPYAESMESCCRIYRKVKDAGRKMLVTMSHRMSQDKKTLETLLKSGQYGGINYLMGRLAMTRRRTNHKESYRPGHNTGARGVLSEAAIHQMDILRVMSGANVKTVYARAWNPSWFQAEENTFCASCLVDMTMENGVQAVCEQSFINAALLNEWGQDYIRAECDKATLILDNRKIEMRCDLSGEPVREEIPLMHTQPDIWSHELLLNQFIDWLEGGAEPECSIEDNLQCVALVYAADESVRTGMPVEVQPFLRRHLEAAGIK